MNTALWIIQGILAAMFAIAGLMKLIQPIEKLIKSGLSWTERFPVSTVRLIGLLEFLVAIGLVLPLWLNAQPILTPLAAIALTLVMIWAIFHHLKHKEYKAIIFNFVIISLSLFVAYCRFTSL